MWLTAMQALRRPLQRFVGADVANGGLAAGLAGLEASTSGRLAQVARYTAAAAQQGEGGEEGGAWACD